MGLDGEGLRDDEEDCDGEDTAAAAATCGTGERDGDSDGGGDGDVWSTAVATVTARFLLWVGSEEGTDGCVRDSLGSCGGSTRVQVGTGGHTATERV